MGLERLIADAFKNFQSSRPNNVDCSIAITLAWLVKPNSMKSSLSCKTKPTIAERSLMDLELNPAKTPVFVNVDSLEP